MDFAPNAHVKQKAREHHPSHWDGRNTALQAGENSRSGVDKVTS